MEATGGRELTLAGPRHSIPASDPEGGICMAMIAVAFAFAAQAAAQAAEPPAKPVHVILGSNDIAWTAGPGSLAPGAQMSVLYGDPTKAEPFAMRLKLPDGFRIAPHTHPRPEIVTVISGAFHLGMGGTADDSKTRRLVPGDFFAFDPGMAHFVRIEGETVVQLNSVGPWGIDYVNPADDPRQKK